MARRTGSRHHDAVTDVLKDVWLDVGDETATFCRPDIDEIGVLKERSGGNRPVAIVLPPATQSRANHGRSTDAPSGITRSTLAIMSYLVA
jgi:hypothetical protein